MDCPYYNRDYKECNFFGTSQDQYQRDTYCLSGSNWKNCVNYTNRSREDKINKKLRSNPEL